MDGKFEALIKLSNKQDDNLSKLERDRLVFANIETNSKHLIDTFIECFAGKEFLKEICLKYPLFVLKSDEITDEILEILMENKDKRCSSLAKQIYYKNLL